MLYDRILIKYGELTLKGHNKNRFINHTIRIIKEKCKNIPNLEFENKYERFYIILNGAPHETVIGALNKVFGLHAYALVAKCENDIEIIKKTALAVVKENINSPVTFKVETHRADKEFPMLSLEVSKEVARVVLKDSPFLKVEVRNPEVTLNIEIRHEATYISTREFPGLGGLPVGMDGKGLLMLSGGIDSPVAGYLIQKRGVALEVIHYASPPFTSDKAKEKVLDLTEKLAHYAPRDKIKVHIVPFTKLQKAIYDHIPSAYTITIMRRMMYRIAEAVAFKNEALILVNGENVGQVASQTLTSMAVINQVTNMPVLRPCATMDKLEIIAIAKKIDTYDISIRPYDDCCTVFVPDKPATKPILGLCEEYEKTFDYKTLIQECVDNIEEIMIQAGQNFQFLPKEEIDSLF